MIADSEERGGLSSEKTGFNRSRGIEVRGNEGTLRVSRADCAVHPAESGPCDAFLPNVTRRRPSHAVDWQRAAASLKEARSTRSEVSESPIFMQMKGVFRPNEVFGKGGSCCSLVVLVSPPWPHICCWPSVSWTVWKAASVMTDAPNSVTFLFVRNFHRSGVRCLVVLVPACELSNHLHPRQTSRKSMNVSSALAHQHCEYAVLRSRQPHSG